VSQKGNKDARSVAISDSNVNKVNSINSNPGSKASQGSKFNGVTPIQK